MDLSTILEEIELIPAPDELRRTAIRLALLEVVCGTRFPKFTWQNKPAYQRLLVDDGGGNRMSIFFTAEGVLITGFDHESPMSPYAKTRKIWPNLFDGMPAAFRTVLLDPQVQEDDDGDLFEIEFAPGAKCKINAVTFAAWWLPAEKRWACSQKIQFPNFDNYETDGAGFLLASLDGEDLDEKMKTTDADHEHLAQQKPIDDKFLKRIFPKVNCAKVHAYIAASGYGK